MKCQIEQATTSISELHENRCQTIGRLYKLEAGLCLLRRIKNEIREDYESKLEICLIDRLVDDLHILQTTAEKEIYQLKKSTAEIDFGTSKEAS